MELAIDRVLQQGVAAHREGNLEDAERFYQAILQSQPLHPLANHNLGVIAVSVNKTDMAVPLFKAALESNPGIEQFWVSYIDALVEVNRLKDVKQAIKKAKKKGIDTKKLVSLLSQSKTKVAVKEPSQQQLANLLDHYNNGRFGDAEKLAVSITEEFPQHEYAWKILGAVLGATGKKSEAVDAYQTAVALSPQDAIVHCNFGVTLQELGRFDEAEASLRQAIALKPDSLGAWDNLLFMLNYDPRLSSAELYREYEAYGAFVSSETARSFDHSNRPSTAGRRIRVGYSSADFQDHVCRFFIEPMFREHDRDQFELFAYSNTKNPDSHTERLKGCFDQWIDVAQLSDEAMAQRIYDDGIDILVDMAGHTKGNRLLAFAMCPAPIQVGSAIGYGYTTGLKEVDYFIGDENLTPEGSEPYFSEKICRVPAPFLAYEPPRDITPDVSDLPALRNGYVTFGSLTRTIRLNDPLLKTWKKILDRVPGSRLRLDQKPFAAEGMRELFWQRLEGLGIPRERVELTCSQPHWLAYQDIDILLDCWPHNAGTTTIESLWMGVPVLSKVDRPSMGCVGAAILKPLGLEDWVVEDETAYIEKAVDYASDLTTLTQLRGSLRQRLERSSLLDAAACTQKIEAAYQQMLTNRG